MMYLSKTVRLIMILSLVLIPQFVTSMSVRAKTKIVTLNFENGTDQSVISSTIPGLRFSNTQGFDWVYGDVRTGTYNAPYPQNCPDYGGTCIYAVSDNFFAWMGAAQGSGRIDFIDGTSTFFRARFSTAEKLTLEAYDFNNKLISSTSVVANTNTGRLDEAEVTAPDGQGIAYILIIGVQNHWLMDDMETDAPGVTQPKPKPFPKPTKKSHNDAAFITVVQQANPNVTVSPGSSVIYTIVIANRGHGPAKNTTISMSIDPTIVRVRNVSFSNKVGWISKMLTNTLELQTGLLGSGGDTVTATIQLEVSQTATDGMEPLTRLSYTWKDSVDGGSGQSNALLLVIGSEDHSQTTGVLAIQPSTNSDDKTYIVTGDGYVPNEPIALWYNTSDNTVVALETVTANADGVLSYTWHTRNMPPEDYTLVAHSSWSNSTATGKLRLH